MFQPNYTYTDKLVQNLLKIEHHKSHIENIDLSYDSKQKLQNQTKVLGMFHTAKLIGIQEITVKDAEKFAFARNYEQPKNVAYQMLVNFRNAIEFNRSSIADTYSELDETVLTHLNKLIIANWRETWDARLRNFNESVDERFDYWSTFRNREIDDNKRLQEIQETIDWFMLNSPSISFVIRLAVLQFKLIELAPFIAGNMLSMTAVIDYVTLKNNFGGKLFASIPEFLHTNTDSLLEAYTYSKQNHDMTFWLERFTENMLSHLVETRERVNKFLLEEEKSKQQPFLNLNKRQIKTLKYLQTVPTIKREDYCHMMDVSTMTAFRDLNDLVRKKLLKVEGKGRGTHYRLASM